ncbi:reverse transcriptase [Gossypium australe]|uniref:Reverse transcriptase n=1 Tax=Gossypium australe TaxID=47621 RepID=A0A5B6VB28_9ROSI|nr:reverse transcriptase [Gossypium australe]
MDFVSGLPLTLKKKDVIWVVIDRLTKSTHFISVRTDYSLDKLVELYISEIVRLHRVPLSIISDRVLRFTLRFWKKLQEALGTKLNFSTAFHPQIDVSKRYKNGTYEALYGGKCRTPLYWIELSEKKIHGVELIRETEEKVKTIRDSLKVASDRQKSYADIKHREIEFQVRDQVFLKVSPWKKVLRFDRKGKLSPRFIGPSDSSHVISRVYVEIQADLTYSEEPIRNLAREIKELRNKRIALVKVLWHKHGIEEATWEP